MAQAVIKRGPVSGTAVRQQTRPRKPFLLDLYSTAVGKKYVMAITGIIWLGFVLVHMLGNLKLYLGREDFDHYAEVLRELLVPILPRTALLWIMRVVLIGAVLLHVHAAFTLTVVNRRARPVKYQSERDYVVASFASRSMRLTGVVVALFLLWHLADFTWGWVNDVGADGEFTRGAAYDNVVRSFERVPVAAFYVLANIALGIHLFHGAWSLFQSLGWSNPRFNHWRRWFAIGFSTVIVVGNVSFPLAVLAGVVD